MPHKAVFLDRDGTIIHDTGYLADPAGVQLLPGVDLAIKSLRQQGFKIVVVTNQSGVARGMLTEAVLEEIHATLRETLAEKGVMLDAIFYCPFHPEGSVARYAKDSDLRKPKPGMLKKAAEQMDLDLPESWMVGDSARDVLAGQTAGCRTILIDNPTGSDPHAKEACEPDVTVRNLVDAARVIMRADQTRAEEQASQATQPPQPEADQPPQPTTKTPSPLQAEAHPMHEDQADQPPVPPAEPTPAGPVSAEAPGESAATSSGPSIFDDSEVRREILKHVRQLSKAEDHEEFNIANLLGGVSQVLVVLFLMLVFYKAIATPEQTAADLAPPDMTPQATLWAVVALIFQTMSLTFYIMARNKS